MHQDTILLLQPLLNGLNALIEHTLKVLSLEIFSKVSHVLEFARVAINADISCHVYYQSNIVFLQLLEIVGCLFSRNVYSWHYLNAGHVSIIGYFSQVMEVVLVKCVELGIELTILLAHGIALFQLS